jgi:dipeptidyl-peptidase-4
MKIRALRHLLLVFLFLILLVSNTSPSQEDKPLTRAESSEYNATSLHKDVLGFIQSLQGLSLRLRVETLGISAEGRNIPLLVIGDPVPSSPQDLAYDERLVVYIQAGIHAGEVEGKEAALMLARDLALAESPDYLKDIVLLVAPIFNPDGNEKISPGNRRNQVGPEQGVGVRPNGLNMDLNRDGMKLESPEVLGLVQNVMLRWDPAVLLDSHTHNGSYHEEFVTWVWALNPNGDTSLIRYMSDRVRPEINRILLDKYDTLCIPHGDFMSIREPEKGWVPLGPQPRYLSNYFGLRNRLGILNENYPYADFKTRITGAYHLFHALLEFCVNNKDDIRNLLHKADEQTIRRGLAPTERDEFAIEYDVRPIKDKITVNGYVMEQYETESNRMRTRKTDETRTYTMPFLAEFFAKRKTRLPFGYLISGPAPEAQKKLLQHGILVERLTKPVSLEVEGFKVQELKGQQRAFQGHRLNSVTGEYFEEEMEFPTGTLFIPMAQPLANVASYLLEPESDDGLLVWNFFDRQLASQWGRGQQVYPVYKLYTPVSLVKNALR